MRRAAALFACAGVLLAARLATSAAGLAEHTSVVAGMPASTWSWLLGPLHVIVHLVFAVVAPVLAIAATLDTVLLLRSRKVERAPRPEVLDEAPRGT
jgi:hypothetical protein